MAKKTNKIPYLIRIVIILFILLGATLVLMELGVNLIEQLNGM